jgi:hypothetical protein
MVKSSAAPKAEKKNFGTDRTADVATLYRSEEVAINRCLAVRGEPPKTKGRLPRQKTKGRGSSIGMVEPVDLGQQPISVKAQQRKVGEINIRRLRRYKRFNVFKVIVGTWNVRTMLQLGKMQGIAEIQKTQTKILALQEIRWKGSGKITKGSYTLFYSCMQEQTGHYGTGFLVMKELMGTILGFEPFNERICKIRIKGKYHNISVVNVRAPTEDKDDETKEVFYEDVQKENT